MKKLLLSIIFFCFAALSVKGITIANKTSNGAIGTAALTVDFYTEYEFAQTTTGITLTVPNLTNPNATAKRVLNFRNTGTADLTLIPGGALPAGGFIMLVWNVTRWAVLTDGKTNRNYQPNTIVLIGDSYTAAHKGGSSPSTTTSSIGFFNWANQKMKRRFQVINYAGVAGQTTATIAARFQADALALNPGWVCIQGGINDVLGNITPAATIYANLVSMFDAAIANNVNVIALTLPMVSDFSTQARYNVVNDVNAMLKRYAKGKNNFFLIDINTVLTDPTTGIVQTVYTYDNRHLSVLGCAVVGDLIASKLSDYAPDAVDMLPTTANDIYTNNSGSTYVNMVPNPMMIGSTAGLATGWATNCQLSTGGNGVLNTDFQQSKVSALNVSTQSYRTFEWQQLKALTASGAEKRFFFRPSTAAMNGTWAVGDWLYLECEFEADNDWTSVTRLQLLLNTLVSSGATLSSIDMFTNDAVNGGYPGSTTPQYVPRSGVLRTYPVQMTALVTSVYPQVEFYAVAGTIRLGRFAIKRATPVTIGGVTTFLY